MRGKPVFGQEYTSSCDPRIESQEIKTFNEYLPKKVFRKSQLQETWNKRRLKKQIYQTYKQYT